MQSNPFPVNNDSPATIDNIPATCGGCLLDVVGQKNQNNSGVENRSVAEDQGMMNREDTIPEEPPLKRQKSGHTTDVDGSNPTSVNTNTGNDFFHNKNMAGEENENNYGVDKERIGIDAAIDSAGGSGIPDSGLFDGDNDTFSEEEEKLSSTEVADVEKDCGTNPPRPKQHKTSVGMLGPEISQISEPEEGDKLGLSWSNDAEQADALNRYLVDELRRKLEEANANMKQEIESLKTEITQSTSQIGVLNNQLSAVSSEKAELELRVESANSETLYLKSSNESRIMERDEANARVDELSSEIKDTNKTLSSLKSEKDGLVSSLEDYRIQITAIANSNSFENAVAQLQAQNERLLTEVNTSKSEINGLHSKIKDANMKLSLDSEHKKCSCELNRKEMEASSSKRPPRLV